MTSPTPKHGQVQPQIDITALGHFGATSLGISVDKWEI